MILTVVQQTCLATTDALGDKAGSMLEKVEVSDVTSVEATCELDEDEEEDEEVVTDDNEETMEAEDNDEDDDDDDDDDDTATSTSTVDSSTK